MAFNNSVVGGVTLIRPAIESPNFSNDPEAGVTGWQIAADGSATFYDVTIGSDDYFVDNNGNAVFNDVSVNGALSVGGVALDDILAARPRGLQFWASRLTDSSPTSGTTEVAVLTLGTVLENGRMYRFSTSNVRISGTVAGDVYSIRLRDGGAAAPTTSSNVLGTAASYIPVASNPACSTSVAVDLVMSCDDTKSESGENLNSGTHNMLLSVVRVSGTGVGTLNTSTGNLNPIQILVEDLGPLVSNTGVNESGGGGSAPVQTYTKTYGATWSESYQTDGSSRGSADSGDCFQGYYSATNGNQFSLIGFDYVTIQSDLAGATITKVEVYLKNTHWYQNSGGTAIIGTHNFTAAPGTATYPSSTDNITRSTFTYGQAKWVTTTTAVGNAFRDNTAKGILLGKGQTSGGSLSNDQAYYGYFVGANKTGEPQLRITYQK